VTGKIGTDIQDNKCSWLVVTALGIMTPEQRAELEVRKCGAAECQKKILNAKIEHINVGELTVSCLVYFLSGMLWA